MNRDKEKALAAAESVKLIKDGMVVGLGSGSTAAFMIRKLGSAVAKGLAVKGVPSSEVTAKLAVECGIPLLSLEEAGMLDINIDGADEFDPQLRLIKGGGGALLREKVLAHNARFNVIIADSSKSVERLGTFKLPIETIPFATQNIITELQNLGLSPQLRMAGGAPYKTDENNCIVDLDSYKWDNLPALENLLLHIPGVVETGLFLDTTDQIIVAKEGELQVLRKQ